MRKTVGVTLFALFLFSMISVASAFAESPLWLVKNVEVAANTGVITVTPALLLSDLKVPLVGETQISCEVTFDGTIGTEGKGEITALLNALQETVSKVQLTEKVGEPALLCSGVKGCEGNASVWPVDLPWTTQLELFAGTLIDNIKTVGAKEVGFEIECSLFGVKETDECLEGLIAPVLENMLTVGPPEENDLLSIIKEANAFLCTISNERSGDAEAETVTAIAAKPTELLVVSGDMVAE
jgi:hypothetical protein